MTAGDLPPTTREHLPERTGSDDAIRPEASAVLAMLIESVTIYSAGELEPEAKVIQNTTDLTAYAAKRE